MIGLCPLCNHGQHDGEQCHCQLAAHCTRHIGVDVILWEKGTCGYHDEALSKAAAILAELATMTSEECAARSLVEHKNAMAKWHGRENTRAAQRVRYEGMRAKVLAWSPPSPDHVGLRDFMVEQLQKSIEFDCGGTYDIAPGRLTPSEWKALRKADAERDIAYHTKARAEAIERTEGQNRWVAQLRESLNNA